MLWFIAAFVIASAIFLLTPEKVVEHHQEKPLVSNEKLSNYSLLILPVIILAWVLISLSSGNHTQFSGTAIGFILTACAVALPRYHKFIAQCASLTFVCLVLELLI